jgi:hypothetical protein
MFNSNLEHLIANRKETTCFMSEGFKLGTLRWTLKVSRRLIDSRILSSTLLLPSLPKHQRAGKTSKIFQISCNLVIDRFANVDNLITTGGISSFL